MYEIRIGKVTLDDFEELQNIARQIIFETFSAANTEENMKNYLNEGFIEREIECRTR